MPNTVPNTRGNGTSPQRGNNGRRNNAVGLNATFENVYGPMPRSSSPRSGNISGNSQGSRGSRANRRQARLAPLVAEAYRQGTNNGHLRASTGGKVPNETSPGRVVPNTSNLEVSHGVSLTNAPFPSSSNGNNAATSTRKHPHSTASNNFMPANLRNVQTKPLCTSKDMKTRAFRDCFDAKFAALWKTQRGATARPCSSTKAPHKDQVRLYELAKAMTRSQTSRGQLVWASTGAGKTVMALCIILAYWDTDYKIVVVTTDANLKQNNPKKYTDNLGYFFPEVVTALRRRHGDVWPTMFRKHENQSDNSAKVLFYTTKKFVNNVVGIGGAKVKAHAGVNITASGGKYVLILDEAHQILEPPVGLTEPETKAMIKLKEALLSDTFATSRVHVWPLTGTPASTVPNWLDMISFVRAAGTRPIREKKRVLDAVKAKSMSELDRLVGPYTQGTVFFSDLRSDLSRHACVRYDPKNVPMDRWYYLASLAVMRALLTPPSPLNNKAKRALQEHKAKREACRATMYLTNTEYKKIVPPKIIGEITRRHRLLGTTWVSNKFIAIIKDIANVTQHRGKVFVYSPHMNSNESVITLLARALTDWFGFIDVTGDVLSAPYEQPYVNKTKRPCFVLWGTKVTKATETKPTRKAKLQCAFNQKSNANGRHIKLYLACGEEYEGTDLTALRHLHITEPMLDPLKERQAVGRGVRYCSHNLVEDKSVRVVRWYGTPPSRTSRPAAELLPWVVAKAQDTVRAALASPLHTREGVEKDLYLASLTDPKAVALYNFEVFLKKQAVRGYAGGFKDVFLAPAGVLCAPPRR